MKIKRGSKPSGVAFTLLEVMIASAIFFVAIVSILGLMSQALGAARSLQQIPPDVSSLAAELAITNILEEGTESGDFGDLYPDVTWTRRAYEVASNGLFQVDFYVQTKVRGKSSETVTSVLLYRPANAGGNVQAQRRIR